MSEPDNKLHWEPVPVPAPEPSPFPATVSPADSGDAFALLDLPPAQALTDLPLDLATELDEIIALDASARIDATAASDSDTSVPMLTDVLQVPRYADEMLPARLEDVDWNQLTQRVRENVLGRLMQESTQMLEQRMPATLQLVVERAVTNLEIGLREALSVLVKEVVAHAVDEELGRLHDEINQRSSL